MALRDVYGNSPRSGYSIDFFSLNAPGARSAMLASPFLTTFEPVRLLTARGCEVRLLVRLCSITTPAGLAEAVADPLVAVRYFTGQAKKRIDGRRPRSRHHRRVRGAGESASAPRRRPVRATF